MKYDLDRIIDATVEPVTVEQAKSHCRVLIDDDDALFAIYIKAAREYCEQVTGRSFLQQTWRLSLEMFPRVNWTTIPPGSEQTFYSCIPYWRTPYILLPRPKLIGVVSVTYLDLTGTRQTLDPSQYDVDFDAEPATISPAPGSYWPAALWRKGSIQITYTSGYGSDPTAVPAPLQLAILMLVGHWYENREATVLPDSGTGVVSVPLGITELLQAYALDLFTLES